MQVLALPPLGVGAAGGFVSHDPRYTVEQAWAVREERILAAFRAVRPVAVLVELFPFGRAKFARELVPLLEAARAAGALTACSLRDILVSRRADQQAYDDRAAALANAHLDAVLVHSDPALRPPRGDVRAAPAAARAGPLHRLRRARRRSGAPPRGDHVVVSAGGGLVGEPLLRAAAEAQPAVGRADAADRRAAAARRRVAARCARWPARASSCGARWRPRRRAARAPARR